MKIVRSPVFMPIEMKKIREATAVTISGIITLFTRRLIALSMTIASLARPEIRALRPYEAAVQVEDTVRLNANEAPRAVPGGNFRRPLNRYPEVRPQRLQSALAARFGCQPGQLLVTRGSSEAIDLVIRAFCRAGRSRHRFARSMG